jgi:glyoxylase-like metal-dependent hydrolase (beta-lactamase superfamily II)
MSMTESQFSLARAASKMAGAAVTRFLCVYIGLLTQMVLAGLSGSGSEFVNLERLSDRVVLAYWVGLDRRCNLTAIRSRQGLVIIDTEMSPRIMAPIKEKLELVFGRSDWVYVINTHAHYNHPGGNGLFKSAVIVGHENLAEDMQWIVRRQTELDLKNRNLEVRIADSSEAVAVVDHFPVRGARGA